MAKKGGKKKSTGQRGCLCKDGTYSGECCDENDHKAQGIGSLKGQSTSVINKVNTTKTITTSHG